MDTDIVLNEAPEQEEAPKEEAKKEEAPGWASEMANTMRALADKVTAPPPTAARPGMTKEQIMELNEKLTKGIVEGNPLGVLAPISNQIAQENLESFRAGLRPYQDEAVDAFLDRFKNNKKEDYEDKGQVALYRQVSKQFSKELENEDLATLLEKPKQERDKVLNRAWKAATGEVLGQRVASTPAPRPQGARASEGGSVGGGNSKAVYALSEVEKRQLYRSMPKDQADAAIKDIESAMSRVGGQE